MKTEIIKFLSPLRRPKLVLTFMFICLVVAGLLTYLDLLYSK